jgi:hypothetical protein
MSDPVNAKNQSWLKDRAQAIHDEIVSLSHNRGQYTIEGYWQALINVLNKHAIPRQTLIDVSAANDHINTSSDADLAKAVGSNNQNKFQNNPEFDGSVRNSQVRVKTNQPN